MQIELLPKKKRESPPEPGEGTKEKATDIPARESAQDVVTDISVGESASQKEMTDVLANTASHAEGRNAVGSTGEQKKVGPSKNSKVKNLEAELKDLREDLSAGTTGGAGEKLRKKPASGLKKPAASRQCLPQTSTVKKRPAALVDATASKAQESKEDKRQRLLSLIPSNARAAYKNGCQKCRNRAYCTPSCWKARGYELHP